MFHSIGYGKQLITRILAWDDALDEPPCPAAHCRSSHKIWDRLPASPTRYSYVTVAISAVAAEIRISVPVQCPLCSHDDSRVTDSRTLDDAIRRRRECLRCAGRFTTYERVQPASVLVVKKDGRREEYSREKVLAGVRKACEKRPLDVAVIAELVEGISETVLCLGQPEVSSAGIGELVMRRLRELDQIAYVRFACVYRDFADLDVLRETIDELQASGIRGARPREQLTLLPEEELRELMAPPRILPLPQGAARRARLRGRSREQ